MLALLIFDNLHIFLRFWFCAFKPVIGKCRKKIIVVFVRHFADFTVYELALCIVCCRSTHCSIVLHVPMFYTAHATLCHMLQSCTVDLTCSTYSHCIACCRSTPCTTLQHIQAHAYLYHSFHLSRTSAHY